MTWFKRKEENKQKKQNKQNSWRTLGGIANFRSQTICVSVLQCSDLLWLYSGSGSSVFSVCDGSNPERPPEDSRSNSWCAVWDGSFSVVVALLSQWELNKSSKEGREQLMIFWAVLMTLWRALLSTAELLVDHAAMQVVSTSQFSNSIWTLVGSPAGWFGWQQSIMWMVYLKKKRLDQRCNTTWVVKQVEEANTTGKMYVQCIKRVCVLCAYVQHLRVSNKFEAS